MRIKALLFTCVCAAALAACSDAGVLEPAAGPALGVTTQRTVYVNAVTNWSSGGGVGSGGYVKGWATSVNGGPGYEMGDVEANDNDAQYMLEDIGYTGQLDAFSYSSGCTYQWLVGPKVVSTAGTIYLSSYPTASNFTLRINC